MLPYNELRERSKEGRGNSLLPHTDRKDGGGREPESGGGKVQYYTEQRVWMGEWNLFTPIHRSFGPFHVVLEIMALKMKDEILPHLPKG